MHTKVMRPFLLGTVSAIAFALPAAGQNAGSEPVETVTVTGYRASLEQALNIKRDTVGVRDSIVAEDIGKFPASNIAESLLRVPGVVLARDTRTDEGRQLTVRGLPAAYTVVTVNGNPIHMETNGDVGSNARTVDLDAFGADLFSRVDFYKSPSARLDEGGIGGVIDLRTPHPFDYAEREISYSIGYGMNSQRRKAVPTGTFQISNTWGPFGALIAVTAKRSSYAFWGNETAGYSQACNENGYMGNGEKYDFGPGNSGSCSGQNPPTWAGVDPRANIGSYTIQQIEQAFIPRWGRDHLTMDDRTRYSGLLSFEFKPNDKLDISFDLLGAELIDATDEYVIGTYFRSTGPTTAAGYATIGDPTTYGKTGASNGLVPLNVGIDSNDNLYGTFGNVQMQSGNVWYRGKDKFLSGTFNTKYHVLDNLTLNAEAGVADFHGFIGNSTLNAYVFNTTLTYDPRDDYKFPSLISSVDLTNPALYQGNTPGTRAGFDTAATYGKEGDRILTGKLSAQYAFESGLKPVGHVDLEYGMSWVGNTKTNDQRNAGGLVKNTVLSNGKTLGTMLPGDYMVNHIKIDNYLSDVNAPHRITNWATIPDSVYYMVPWTSVLASDTSGNWYPSVFKLTEGVTSFYLNASSIGEVLGRTLKVDFGLRYAITRTWGYNYSSQTDPNTKITTYTKQILHSSYDSLLPTLAVSYDLMEDLVFRAAYGQTITRADLGSIAKGASVPNIYNQNVTIGNSALKPFTASNIDFGLEWYFDQGSVLSLGVFYKGIKNLISTQTTANVPWGTLNLPDSLLASNLHINNDLAQPVDPNLPMNVTHPVNLNPMVVKGFEIFYQQPFTFLPEPFDGLGAMASFTYTAGTQNGPGSGFTANDGTIYRMPLKGLSAYSYSATAYYEKNGISLRLSYNWRSKYGADDSLDNLNYYKSNTRIWAAARGTLDLTAGYAFNDWAEVRLDISNVLNAQEVAMLRDATGKDTKIGQRYSGFGDPNTHNFYDYVHGRNYMLSLRGHL